MTTAEVLAEVISTGRGVALAVVPLAALFVAFQFLILRLPAREVSRIARGTLLASVGLFLFLVGVGIGYLPFGRAIGEAIGRLPEMWMLAPFGIALGFVTAWGEPAVRILAEQVESASSGSIRQSLVLWAICIGVALAVGVGMLRIGYGIPLLHLVVPGYVLVIGLIFLSERSFVAIAVDAGGVATGPLANTFLLALALGASATMGDADPLVHGLGLLALIALAPVMSVMALGLLVRLKQHRKES